MSRETSKTTGAFLPARPLPLGTIVEVNARDFPDSIAITDGERTTTWRALDRLSNRVAHGLAKAGIDAGSHVAVLGRTCDSMFEVLHGVAKAGCIFNPVNWRLAPSEISHILRDSDSEILFVTSELHPLIERIGPEIEKLRRVIVLSDQVRAGSESYTAWRDSHTDASAQWRIEPRNAVLQLYTSGTTGRPKGAVFTQDYFVKMGQMMKDQAEEPYRKAEGEEFLHYFPIFHIGGIGTHYHPTIRGCGMIILPEFDPGEVLRLIGERNIPVLTGVPTMHQALLDNPKFAETDFSRVRYCMYGAAPMPTAVRDRLMSRGGCRFVQYYGMTECAYISSLDPSDHEGAFAKAASVGKPPPGVEIKIIDSEGCELPRETAGEIAIRTPLLMEQYWKLPKETDDAFRDGWFLTGDGGYIDRDGYLFLKDRIKDMIISGGENIYPVEIENVLYQHPSVSSAAVVGVPDEKWGEVPKAFIVLKQGESFSPRELSDFLASRLGRYKLPKFYEQIDALPLNASGKILKRELRLRTNESATRV